MAFSSEIKKPSMFRVGYELLWVDWVVGWTGLWGGLGCGVDWVVGWTGLWAGIGCYGRTGVVYCPKKQKPPNVGWFKEQ
jgi:hypothetical protein